MGGLDRCPWMGYAWAATSKYIGMSVHSHSHSQKHKSEVNCIEKVHPGQKIEWQDLTRIVSLIISDLIRSDEKSYEKLSSQISYTKSY
jgi:hypothetical protein